MNYNVNSFCFYVSRGYHHTFFFFKCGENISKKDFCLFNKAKPRTYWGTILSRLFLYHTRDSFSPLRLYEKYYKNEYRSYADFLGSHFLLSEDEIKMCANTTDIWCKDLNSDSDSTIHYLEYVDDYSFGNPYDLINNYFNRTMNDED